MQIAFGRVRRKTAPDYKEGFEIKSQNTSQSLTLVFPPSIVHGRGCTYRDSDVASSVIFHRLLNGISDTQPLPLNRDAPQY